MDPSVIVNIMQSTMLTVLKIALPLLGVSMLVGLVIAIFQAATQIHEQTLTFVPKLLTIAFLLLAMSTYIMSTMTDFVDYLFDIIVELT